MHSVTFVDGHCARHVRRDNLGLHVPVPDLVGVGGLLLVHDGRAGFSREAREAGTHSPLCVVSISVVGVDGSLLVHDGRAGFSRKAREAGTHSPLCVVSISLVGVDGFLLAHDGRVGFSRKAREAGTHTPLCVVRVSPRARWQGRLLT